MQRHLQLASSANIVHWHLLVPHVLVLESAFMLSADQYDQALRRCIEILNVWSLAQSK